VAVGVQLIDLVRGVRAETGKSLSVAQGVAEFDALVYQIQQKQEWLYYNYDWPFLLTHQDVALTPGTRFYAYPAQIAFDFINTVVTSETGQTAWSELLYGVGPAEFNQIGEGEQGTPARKWQIGSATPGVPTQMEVWPVPSAAAIMRVYGRAALKPLVAGPDISTLDGTLIILHVAADILARNKMEDAQLKLQQANTHMRNIARRQGNNKRQPFVLGGSIRQPRALVPGLDYIPDPP
jgi:hypothetical protein